MPNVPNVTDQTHQREFRARQQLLVEKAKRNHPELPGEIFDDIKNNIEGLK